jgi:hypothetical protein
MQDDFHDADLANWLKEAGRRRVVRPASESDAPATDAAAAPAAKPRNNLRHRYLLLFSLAALSYLPYFFADVYLQIATLPRVIVFV